ncbi:MAG: division/cell wall cluster transcriptional repressor MraZ [Taibaiella sp.]|nr:division/cell wall cluster transcriptional repressor MraZ [Taibaiella sp.]
MLNLIGEYEVSVDAKGRFLLPASFRKQLSEGSAEQFVINRGFENCLVLYPMESWNAISAKVDKLNDFKPKVREFKRLFRNGATVVEVDSAGRILVPKMLLERAGIQKDMVFTAQGNKVELWNKDTYYSYIDEHKDNFSDLAEEVTGGNDKLPDDE